MSQLVHQFSVDDAEKYGQREAVILYHIRYWTDHNRIEGTNQIDGGSWMWSTAEKMQKHWPYFTIRQIRYALNKLEEDGAIISANYNKNPSDRTKWYAIAEKKPVTKLSVACDDFVTSSIREDISNKNKTCASVQKLERFEEWWKNYPVKKNKDKAKIAWSKYRLDDKADELIGILLNQKANDAEWKRGIGIPHPTTYMNQKRWKDEVTHEASKRPTASQSRTARLGDILSQKYEEAVARENGAADIRETADTLQGPVVGTTW